MIVTEVTDIEEVNDERGALLYVEYLVAVFDRNEKDPSSAKVLGTQKVRVSPKLNELHVEEIDPESGEKVNEFSANRGMDIESVVNQAQTNVESRIDRSVKARKWRAERFSN